MTVFRPALVGTAFLSLLAFGYVAEHRDTGRPERPASVASDTVDIWPAAGLPHRDQLLDLMMPDYLNTPPTRSWLKTDVPTCQRTSP